MQDQLSDNPPETHPQAELAPRDKSRLIYRFCQHVMHTFTPKEGDPFIFPHQQRVLDTADQILKVIKQHPDAFPENLNLNTFIEKFIEQIAGSPATRKPITKSDLEFFIESVAVNPKVHGGLTDTIKAHWEQSLAEELSLRDPLTGLYNRQVALDHLHRLIKSRNPNQPFALLYFDLNHFKNLNDQRGHAQGDQALIEVAKILSQVRTGDTVARMGGDEFVIILEDFKTDTPPQASDIIKKISAIRSQIQQVPLTLGLSDQRLDFACGGLLLTNADVKSSTTEQLLTAAERLMAEVKIDQHQSQSSITLGHKLITSLAELTGFLNKPAPTNVPRF